MILYLLSSHTPLNLLFDIFCGLAVLVGGWLAARSLFPLRPSERFAVGLALGLLLDAFWINLLGHWLPVAWAFWLGPVLVLLTGLGAAVRRRSRHVPQAEWQAALLQAFALAALTGLFWGMLRGMYVFDDYFNLPLLSTIAAGNFPPRFPVNADLQLDYHYALHLLAGGFVRWGGLTVWGIWDGIRALVAALTLILAWLWGKRITRRSAGGWFLLALLAFGSGTRWLLLLLPGRVVQRMGADLTLLGTAAASGPDLLTNLTAPWAVGGLSPLQVPFALVNGFRYPVIMMWGGSGALPLMALLLLLLLYPRRPLRPGQAFVLTALLAAYALVIEYAFVFLMTGLGLIWLGWLWQFVRTRQAGWLQLVRQWAALAAAALLLAMLQGGVFSGFVLNTLMPANAGARYGYSGLSLRWPPALVSGHLGPLSLTNPWQTALAVIEIGPVLLLVPFLWAFAWGWLRRSQRAHLEAALALGATIGFVLSLFLRYGVERDLTRLFAVLITVSLVLAGPRLWLLATRWRDVKALLFWGGFGMVVFSGVVLFALQLLSWKTPLLSDYLWPPDAHMARKYWNRLPEDALVLDRLPERAVVVTGRLTRARSTPQQALPEFDALIADLDPYRAAKAGFDYVYMDGSWWNDLNATRERFLQADCVQMTLPEQPFDITMRWLIDIRKCR